MAAADYRLMTEATGQRIAAALEALSGTGAAAAAARANLDVYSTGETDELIAQSTAGAINDIATRMNITGADDTWSEIYSKLSRLPNRGTATLYIMNTTAGGLLTNGKAPYLMMGTVVQSNVGIFEFMMKQIGTNYIFIWRIEGLTSADATPTIKPVYRFTGTAM